MQRFEADEEAGTNRPELTPPPVEPDLDYMVTYLMTVGPATAGEVLTFQEIQAWRRETGRVLNVWEVETLQRLSRAYLSEYHQAKDRDRPPPFAPAAPINDRRFVSSRILEMYRRMADEDAGRG